MKTLLEKTVKVNDNIGSTEQVTLKIVKGERTEITYNIDETIITLTEQDIKTITEKAKP